jgi:hypothetical protein
MNNQQNNNKRTNYMEKLGMQHSMSISSTQTGTMDRFSSFNNVGIIEVNDTDTVGGSSLSYEEPQRGKSVVISSAN